MGLAGPFIERVRRCQDVEPTAAGSCTSGESSGKHLGTPMYVMASLISGKIGLPVAKRLLVFSKSPFGV
jgi:hypothetical protein